MSYMYSAEPETEDARTQSRRRIQQRRCLKCGSRALVNRQMSYFCRAHIATHRYCMTCGALRTAREHGRAKQCRSCSATRSLAYYHANSERTIYRIRLRQIAQRTATRGDQIFTAVRRRIALADLVAATPGWSWPRRASRLGVSASQLAISYKRQVRGDVRDPDSPDRARRKRGDQ